MSESGAIDEGNRDVDEKRDLGFAPAFGRPLPCAAEDQAATPPAQADEPQWSEFQSPERGFAVEFPGTPKMTSTPMEKSTTRSCNTISR